MRRIGSSSWQLGPVTIGRTLECRQSSALGRGAETCQETRQRPECYRIAQTTGVELMRRFVILEHDHPQLHWDLMLEAGPALRTWRLSAPLAAGSFVAQAAF